MTILVTSTTCTTRMCIEYDYMHMHVRTLHYMCICKELYRVFNMIGSRYNQIDY